MQSQRAFVAVLGVALVCACAWGQTPLWETHIEAGHRAFGPNDAEAERQYLAGLREAARLGIDNPKVAKALTKLGFIYQLRRNNPKAEEFYRRALEMNEKTAGLESKEVAETLAELATFYDLSGRYAAAEAHYKRGLQIAEKEWAEHKGEPYLLWTFLNNLSAMYKQKGRFMEAAELEARAKAIRAMQTR